MPIPFPFVLDELQDLNPHTRAMFGCTAVYIGLKLVLIMRNKNSVRADNGVWLATTHEHHASLKKEFPHMRSLTLFGKKPTRRSPRRTSGRSTRNKTTIKDRA